MVPRPVVMAVPAVPADLQATNPSSPDLPPPDLLLHTAPPDAFPAPDVVPAPQAPLTLSDTPIRRKLDDWANRLDAIAADLEARPESPLPPIGSGPTLRRGMTDERVGRMINRLIELGYLPASEAGSSFTQSAALAVRAYQTAQGFKADGLVGAATRQGLDRGPRETARLIRRSAQSMRQLRDTAPDTVVLVNLPSGTSVFVRDGQEVLTMRSIVGRPSRETPLLEDRITHIVVNPTWTVPPTILREDKLPSLRARGTPGVSNAIVYLDGEAVDPAIIDWYNVSPNRLRIVQQPGDHNALGRFRFNLTNRDHIFLHGTNEPHLFDRDLRTISSGCVRLEDARLMAETILAGTPYDSARIDRMLASRQPRWIKLTNPVEVRFVYWTAVFDEFDRLRIFPDAYELLHSNEDEPERRA